MTHAERLEQEHAEICKSLHETWLRKNADYGAAFSELRRKYPEVVLIHINEKLSRLETLFTRPPHVVGESIEDSLLDLANYAVMELAERRAAQNPEE